MAEIRLICPGCAAEYRVPDSAIPPGGREVECSACGNVWHTVRPQAAEPAPAGQSTADQSPAEPPRLSRRLPSSVLDILRDEVEHERRARAAEDPGSATPDAPDTAPRQGAEPEWPATTITRHNDPRPAEQAREQSPPPSSTLLPPAPVHAPTVRHRTDAPVFPTAEAPQVPVDPVPPAPGPTRNHYGAGFGLALMLAAGVAAFYLMAPVLADKGAFGQGVMDLRTALDQARLWLHDRATPLLP